MRKKFNAAEVAILKKGPCAPVEWRNGSHWLPGELCGEGRDTFGLHYAVVRNLKETRTVGKGEHVRAYPGFLRGRN